MPSLSEKMELARQDLDRLEKGWRPGDEDLVGAVPLSDWFPIKHRALNVPALAGDASNHPRLGMDLITTSPVLWISEDRAVARCLSRWYRLGTPRDATVDPVLITTWAQVKEIQRRFEEDQAFEIGQYPLPAKPREDT